MGSTDSRLDRLLTMTFAGAMGFGLGCSAPVADQRPLVAESLAQRTGFGLGDGAVTPESVRLDDGVNEEEGCALALWCSPAFQAALSELGLARADVERAGLLTNPVLALLFPWGGKQLELTARMPLETLWLRPLRVAAAQLDHELVATLLVRDGSALVRDVRQSWARLRGAQARTEVLRELAANRERVAAVWASRLEHGDATAAEVLGPGAAARLAAIEAERAAVEVALIRGRLIERIAPRDGSIELRLEAGDVRPELSPPQVEPLVLEALASRPELRAAELTLESAAARAQIQRRDVVLLTGVLDANDDPVDGLEVGPGVNLELPIFGRRSTPELARAHAEFERAAWRMVETKRSIEREVREAQLTYARAHAAVAELRAVVLPALAEAQRAAERGEAEGATGGLEPLEAAARLLEARRTEVDFEIELELARSQLEYSVGRKLE